MKIIEQILEEEKEEIQNLFERLNSLRLLGPTLADSRLEIDEQNWFYEKLIKDISETQRKFENWWESISNKYGLDKEIIYKYQIDFENNYILMHDE